MKNKLLAIVATTFFALSTAANAVVVTISGTQNSDGQWDITTVAGPVGDYWALLMQQEWWGDQFLAETFARALGGALGSPNVGGHAPYFAFLGAPNLPQLGLTALNPTTNQLLTNFPQVPYSGVWAVVARASTSCELTTSEFQRSVSIQASGPTMFALFVPSNGCTVDEVAADMGFDHFNWVQVITHYDGLLFAPGGIPINFFTPFLDPPDGGYISPWHPADSLPYYWDEVYGWPLDPAYHLDNQSTSPTNLIFEDIPRSATITMPGQHMAFTTSLVGVIRGSIWIPQFTFTWKSNYNGRSGGTGSGRNLSPPEGGDGAIFDVQLLEDPLAVPLDVQDLWEDNGGFREVPKDIDIDVKPGSDRNCLNIDGKGVIPVAILGSDSFDVLLIEPTSLAFGGLSTRRAGNGSPMCSAECVNDDDLTDLVCKFEEKAEDWVARDNTALLRGELFDGTAFVGTDAVCMLPPQKSSGTLTKSVVAQPRLRGHQ